MEKYQTGTTNPMNVIKQNQDNSLLVGDSWGNGNIQLELIGGGTVTFTSVLVGTFLHVCTTNVVAATASNLIGLQ